MSDEIEYLKKLVSQLNDKIVGLENKAKETAKGVKNGVSGAVHGEGIIFMMNA